MMSKFISTDEILNRAQEFVVFDFFSFPCSKKNMPFVGSENLIYLIRFRDLDAKQAFLSHFQKKKISTEQWLFLVEEQKKKKNQVLISRYFSETQMNPAEFYPIYGADAREFFAIQNLEKLTTVLTVQRKLETTKHAKVIQSSLDRRYDGAM